MSLEMTEIVTITFDLLLLLVLLSREKNNGEKKVCVYMQYTQICLNVIF